jgi:hypothetical protein
MAVKRAHRTITLGQELHLELIERTRSLGYRTVSEYVRVILSREFREPRIPKSIVLLGRKPRQIGLHRPKH